MTEKREDTEALQEKDHNHAINDSFQRVSNYEFYGDRVGFLRKVLGIVSFQLFITFSVVIYSTYTPAFQALMSNVFIVILAFILAIAPLVFLFGYNLT